MWKFLLLFYCTFLPFSLSNFFSDEVVEKLEESISFRQPECMNKWIEGDFHVISNHVKEFFGEVESNFLSDDRKSCRETTHVVVTGTDSTMPRWFNHFPHFVAIYLRYLTNLLWHQRVYSLQHSCEIKFMVNSTHPTFWSLFNQPGKYSPAWVPEFVQHTSHALHSNLLTSEKQMIKKFGGYVPVEIKTLLKPVLHHASDGTMLTSSFLHQSPCKLYNQSTELLRQPLTIFILNRENRDRGFLNIAEMKEALRSLEPALSSTFGLQIKEIKEIHFEGLTLHEQVELIYPADVVIGIHGAAFTNILFMKPCSIILEVLPWLFHAWDYFIHFTKPLELIKHRWMENSTSTVRFPVEKDTKECLEIIKHFHDLDQQAITEGRPPAHLDFMNKGSVSTKCMEETCSLCARKVLGVKTSLDLLKGHFLEALKERQECIKTHRFYHPI